MNLLAFDTSTGFLSIAVARGDRVWLHHGVGGAQASATLIPAILALLAQAGLALPQLDAVVFGRGPGSFTGLRTACAVAQGLAWGAGIPVLPVDTLLAAAEDARHRHGCTQVVAALDARMDEVYCAQWEWIAAANHSGNDAAHAPDATGYWRNTRPCILQKPEQVQVPAGWALAGNAPAVYGARLAAGSAVAVSAAGGAPHQAATATAIHPAVDTVVRASVHAAIDATFEALPTAAAMLRLAPALIAAGQAMAAAQALPFYMRDNVAKTTAERAAEKAVAAAATAASALTALADSTGPVVGLAADAPATVSAAVSPSIPPPSS